jgi:hypothetical protein
MLRACSSDVTTPYELTWTANVRMQSMASLMVWGHARDNEVRSGAGERARLTRSSHRGETSGSSQRARCRGQSTCFAAP